MTTEEPAGAYCVEDGGDAEADGEGRGEEEGTFPFIFVVSAHADGAFSGFCVQL